MITKQYLQIKKPGNRYKQNKPSKTTVLIRSRSFFHLFRFHLSKKRHTSRPLDFVGHVGEIF